MMNYSVIIGRISSDLEMSKDNILNVELAIPRNYRNAEGDYTTDFIDCRLHGNLATNTVSYTKKGDLVAIKGSLEKDGKMMYVRAEKISFLASKSSNE